MTTRRLFILTGASRGLGAAIARQLLAADTHLLTLSRHPDPALGDAARAAGAVLEQWALDLSHDIGSAARLETWLHQHSAAQFAIGHADQQRRAGRPRRPDRRQRCRHAGRRAARRASRRRCC